MMWAAAGTADAAAAAVAAKKNIFRLFRLNWNQLNGPEFRRMCNVYSVS